MTGKVALESAFATAKANRVNLRRFFMLPFFQASTRLFSENFPMSEISYPQNIGTRKHEKSESA